ncbi:MAG TPA: phosphatase PAP2 family protein, partial [Acidimicrobiales bacterium]|nr:phosphatase PAP2 family protein [Acidimicrobiales bacterium]
MAWFTWKVAAVASLGLVVLALLVRSRRQGVADYLKEAAVILGLYAIWQLALDFLVTSVAGAVPHGTWVWRVERSLHLPSEISVQRAALAHPLLIQSLNIFYSVVHFPALIVFLVWLFARHRDRYSDARTTLILLTG